MKRLLRYAAAAALLLLLPFAANAAEGYLTEDLTAYAGPDVDYPEVAYIPAGTMVTIWGCVDGYAWCDVSVDEDRGWVSGNAVQFEYGDRWVDVHEYGPRIGVPVVAFVLGTYWGLHYHHYGWYNQRDVWVHSVHGHRPSYSHYNVHYVPEHHYGSDRHLPPGYANVHHTNAHYAQPHASGDHYSHAGSAEHHGTPEHHGGTATDHHSGTYVNHAEPINHHGAATAHTGTTTADHHASTAHAEPATDHHGSASGVQHSAHEHTAQQGHSTAQSHSGQQQQHSSGQMGQQQHASAQGHGSPQGQAQMQGHAQQQSHAQGQAHAQSQGHSQPQGQSKQNGKGEHGKGDPQH